MEKKTVAIFGAGVSGLTAAHELAERGYDVTVYESSSTYGGKTKSGLTAEGYPTEHSIRAISCTYYHLRDTFGRIPTQAGKTVLDNVVPPSTKERKVLLFNNSPAAVLPCYFPVTWRGIKEYWKFIQTMKKLAPLKEIIGFNFKLLKAGAICEKRRNETLEKMSWDDFLDIKNKSSKISYYLRRMSDIYVGGKGNTNAKSMSLLLEKTLFLPLIHPIQAKTSSPDLLNGPLNITLVDPWINYLKKLGVKFKTTCELKHIEINNNYVDHVIISENGSEHHLKFDAYILALALEHIKTFINDNPQLSNQVSTLQNLDKKFIMEMSSGIQFFCSNIDTDKIPKGWMALMNGPWSIIAIYLTPTDYANYHLNPPATGILSTAFSNFEEPGILYGKPATACTAEEIKNEVWAQVCMHQGVEMLKNAKIHAWHIDSAIDFSSETGVMIKHNAPLYVRLPNSYQHQPTAQTEVTNLFLASDYIKTSYDIPTMEAANEGARSATNAILEYTKYNGKKCFLKKEATTGLALFQRMDSILYAIQCSLKKLFSK